MRQELDDDQMSAEETNDSPTETQEGARMKQEILLKQTALDAALNSYSKVSDSMKLELTPSDCAHFQDTFRKWFRSFCKIIRICGKVQPEPCILDWNQAQSAGIRLDVGGWDTWTRQPNILGPRQPRQSLRLRDRGFQELRLPAPRSLG
ncbi:uncharacterized protein LOC144672833 [Cetorhinus maximus]